MKKLLYSLAALALSACVSCTRDQALQTEVRDYADSTAHSYLTMHAELPVPADAASRSIRQALIDVMDEQLSQIAPGEQQRYFPRFNGKMEDTDALMTYYKDQTLAQIGKLSQEDADERERYIREDPDLSEEDKARILADAPVWSYDFKLEKTADTLGYAVFLSQNYVYAGGAHGGVTGAGYLTFDKQSGQWVKSLIDPACTAQIQPLLVKGLLRYYADCGVTLSEKELREQLQIEGDEIPLPAWSPSPVAEGLSFVYQQYEIASYADGMPSFVLSLDELDPFLTPEARKLLKR